MYVISVRGTEASKENFWQGSSEQKAKRDNKHKRRKLFNIGSQTKRGQLQYMYLWLGTLA